MPVGGRHPGRVTPGRLRIAAVRGKLGRVALPDHPSSDRSSIRASDADRHQTIEVLRKHTAEGRLTVDEFDQRVGEAYEARTLGELQRCTRDLPMVNPPPARVAHTPARHRRDPNLVGFVTTSLLLIFIWAMAGAGYPWPLWAIVPMGLIAAKRHYTREG